MASSAELSSFDLRYDSYRMKAPALEARLLASIVERGIEEPLQGVDVGPRRLLLNGFKRYRCAHKLGLGVVPYTSLADDEAAGILAVLRASNHNTLSILEQARFLDDLRTVHKLSLAEIATTLSRSKAWVCMRLGLLGELTETVRDKLFTGAFPVYAYMYTLRPFMRMNGDRTEVIDEFVRAVSGKHLSIREIQQLAYGYFRGDDDFREQLRHGHIPLLLARTKGISEHGEGCNEQERALLHDLEILQKYMPRASAKSTDARLKTAPFCAQANLLTTGILSRVQRFTETMRKLHDRTGPAQGHLSAPPGGDGHTRDFASPAPEPQFRANHPRSGGVRADLDSQRQDPARP